MWKFHSVLSFSTRRPSQFFHLLHIFSIGPFISFLVILTGTLPPLVRRLEGDTERSRHCWFKYKKRVKVERKRNRRSAAVELIKYKKEENPMKREQYFLHATFFVLYVSHTIHRQRRRRRDGKPKASSWAFVCLFFPFRWQSQRRRDSHLSRTQSRWDRKEFRRIYESEFFMCMYGFFVGGMMSCHSLRSFFSILSWQCSLLPVNHDRFMFTIYSKLDWERANVCCVCERRGKARKKGKRKVQFSQWMIAKKFLFSQKFCLFLLSLDFFFAIFSKAPSLVCLFRMERKEQGREGMSNFLKNFTSFKLILFPLFFYAWESRTKLSPYRWTHLWTAISLHRELCGECEKGEVIDWKWRILRTWSWLEGVTMWFLHWDNFFFFLSGFSQWH